MFAITTRNKLRSRRHAVSMFWAWVHIRAQLSRTPGMLAYTTGIANLTEFFTLTLWEKEIDMTLFMASEDHRDMMWNARRWSESFWSMRWNATRDEAGAWSGRTFVEAEAPPGEIGKYVGPGYLEASSVPEGLRPYLQNIIRQSEPNTLPVSAVIGRVPVRQPFAAQRLKRFLAEVVAYEDVREAKVCRGLGECLVLVVWNGAADDGATALTKALLGRFPQAWAMRFNATDFEIGLWNGLRIRELANAADSGVNRISR